LAGYGYCPEGAKAAELLRRCVQTYKAFIVTYRAKAIREGVMICPSGGTHGSLGSGRASLERHIRFVSKLFEPAAIAVYTGECRRTAA
jgi:hypothetical protein